MSSRPPFAALLSLLCIMGLAACDDGGPVPPVRDNVLHPGQSVSANTRYGYIKITYISPTQRKYEWDQSSRIVDMQVRPEPFDGMLGLYDPADCFLFCPDTRLVLQESVRNFQNDEQLYALFDESSAITDWVYTDDGLAIGFGRSPSRQQINVDLWQFLVHGKKPGKLKGARPAILHFVSK